MTLLQYLQALADAPTITLAQAEDTVGPVVLSAIVLAAALLGVGLTLGIQHLIGGGLVKSAKREAAQLAERAKSDAKTAQDKATFEAEKEASAIRERAEGDIKRKTDELRDQQRALEKAQDKHELAVDRLEREQHDIEEKLEEVEHARVQVNVKRAELDKTITEQKQVLLKAANMSEDEAAERALKLVQEDMREEAGEIVRHETEKAQAKAKEQATDIILNAMGRYAGEIATEMTIRTVNLPSDDVKGRIIGREGRNIKAFQQVAGVDLIVDDTPGVVVVSSFDKVRQTIAAEALEKLMGDGRIHPSSIEQAVAEKKKEINERIKTYGDEAVTELHLRRVHPEVVKAMGRLMYRTSYGQNVLKHSIEVGFLCQIIADQLGLNGRIARRCGFLHDIGKAMDHEVEGPHPAVGADFAKRFGEKEPVINAIAAHHGDIPATSFYTPIVMAADALSGARPGARRESMEKYIQKLEQLQGIAMDFRGVTEAHAVQAGREVRVMVDAKELDDNASLVVARQIADRVSKEMTFPGEIKVTVLRETRAVEVAR